MRYSTKISGSSGNCSSRQIFTLSSSSFSLLFFAAATLLLLTFRYSRRAAAVTTLPFPPPNGRAIHELLITLLLPEREASSKYEVAMWKQRGDDSDGSFEGRATTEGSARERTRAAMEESGAGGRVRRRGERRESIQSSINPFLIFSCKSQTIILSISNCVYWKRRRP